MDTLTFQCGHCNKLMAVGTSFLGKQVRCPHCQQVVIAPQQPAPTSPLPEAAKEEDPLAANPAAESPFAVAPDAPWWANPTITASEPPSAPVPPPPSPADPMSHLDEPPMELAAAAPPPAPQTPFDAFESAVNDSTPAAPTGAAVLDPPGLQAETNRMPAGEMLSPGPLPSAPDIATPWGEGAAPATDATNPDRLIAPRARRSQLGLTLFISLVFLPLVLYAILVTILAVMFYQQRGEGGQQDPRQFLPDVEGDHPGFKRPNKQSLAIPDRYYTDPLPASLRVGLGRRLTIGDLEVLPEKVEWGKVHITLGRAGPFEVDHPALILHLKLRNVSHDVSFYPLDAYFNRQWGEGEGEKPLTFVEAGPARYYGGPARWRAREVEVIEGTNNEKSLEPGESDEYLVCTNCYEPETQKLGKYSGHLLWRVQLRRGLVHYRDKDLSATAVIGVEFTDKDIAHAEPRN